VALLAASVAGLALAGTALWSMYFQDPSPIAPGDRVTVSPSGMSLLRDEGETAPASCSLTHPGGVRLSLEELPGDSVVLDTGTFQHVAATPGRAPAGTYDFTCSGGGEGLYAARRLALGDAALVGAGGLGMLAFSLAAGTVAVVLTTGHRSRVSPRAG
jgi:hypothetical protein